MRIVKLGEADVIMSNPISKHNFFAWPSLIRLQNGKIAVGASGFRLAHVCPFGKAVMAFSEDEGETFTAPMTVIDTPLDDRDAGFCTFGESGLIITSFNNSAEMQRKRAYYEKYKGDPNYKLSYIDTISAEDEEKYLGSTFRISRDCGVTFGELYRSPITSPHGPIELQDGRVIWVGTTFSGENEIQVHTIDTDTGVMEYVTSLEGISRDGENLMSCEPYAIQLPSGKIICHIRVQQAGSERKIMTIYQSESEDNGYTWTTPKQILGDLDGAPPHLCYHSSGVLISAYGRREVPYGVRVMFSKDEGKSWDTNHVLFENPINRDGGYPATVELEDGSLLTVFYTYPKEDGVAVICKQKWRFEEE